MVKMYCSAMGLLAGGRSAVEVMIPRGGRGGKEGGGCLRLGRSRSESSHQNRHHGFFGGSSRSKTEGGTGVSSDQPPFFATRRSRARSARSRFKRSTASAERAASWANVYASSAAFPDSAGPLRAPLAVHSAAFATNEATWQAAS